MTFQLRYLTEEQVEDFVAQSNTSAMQVPAKAPTPAAPAPAPAPPTYSASTLINSAEATDSLNRKSPGNTNSNSTVDDSAKLGHAVAMSDARGTSSLNPGHGVRSVTEATVLFNGMDIDARVPGPYDNKLTPKLKDIKSSTGMNTDDLSPTKSTARITTGEKSKFGLDRSHAKREARDGLKTAQNVMDDGGVKNVISSTMEGLMDSVYFKISSLVEEYTNQDVEKAATGPVKHSAIPRGQGVQPGNHTAQTQRMVGQVANVVDDKAAAKASVRNATMPTKTRDYAAEHTTGLKSNQYAQKYETDSVHANTQAQKEERKGAEAAQAAEAQGQGQ